MKRLLLLSIAALLFAATYSTNAYATRGAYIYTKHGGGTTDGVSPCPSWGPGVNRALGMGTGTCAAAPAAGSEYFGTTYSAEAGVYNSGECAHCHEPHASFGLSTPPYDPPPNTAADVGPAPYLLMKEYSATADSYANLCWYCHENISNINGSGSLTGYGRWGFYQAGPINAAGGYKTSSHYLNADGGTAMAWPGTSGTTPADAPLAWPRQSPRATTGGNVNGCLNCHTPHGVSGTYDSGAAPTYAAGGDTNYSVSTAAVSALIPRQLIARGAALCLRCHDSTGPAATNIKAQVDMWGFVAPTQWTGFPAGGSSGHPVREVTYLGRHNLANESQNNLPVAGWFTSGNRHAECTDCHNPHAATGRGTGMAAPYYGYVFQRSINTQDTQGNGFNTNRYTVAADSTSSPVKVGPVNKGVWGVTVTASGGSITGTKQNLDPSTDYLYQLCLKCHSYWTWNGTNTNTNTGTAVAPLWNAPTSTRTFTTASPNSYARANLSMSNQAWEFATDGVPPPNAAGSAPSAGNRVAYHPVFASGRNRPETYTQQFATGTRNPCWCAGTTCPPTVATYATSLQGTYGAGTCADFSGTGKNIGARNDLTGNMIATLSENFVPPWLHTSKITCVDCHEDSANTTPRGPHGSTRQFILRGLDTSISFTKCLTAACATTTAYTYGGITDVNNLCLNCHRADVYGYQATNSVLPNFPRQSHTTYNGGDGFAGNAVPTAPNGIMCMVCHGGSRGKLGAIHGNDYVANTVTCTSCTSAGRLIAAAGAGAAATGEWDSWTKSAVGTAGGCVQSTSPYCGRSNAAAFGAGANYNY